MAMYQNPQAAMSVLMGGPPTPEEQEIASRILATDGGLPQALENMGAAPPSVPQGMAGPSSAPPSVPQGMATQPQMAQQAPLDPDLLDRLMRSMERDNREAWSIRNFEESVPWNPNLTWGVYLGEIFERQGPEAVDTIIDQQLKAEEPPQEEPPSRMPVLPTLPMPGPNQQLEAAAPPPPAPPPGPPPTAPVGGQGGIMAAANGGLVNFALGGLNDEDDYREHMYDPEPEPDPAPRADAEQDDYEWRGGPEGTGTGYATGLRSRPGTRVSNAAALAARGRQGGPPGGPWSPGTWPHGLLTGAGRMLDTGVQAGGDIVSGVAGGLGNLGRRAFDEVRRIRERRALDRQLGSTGINLAEAAIYGAPLPPTPPRVRPPGWPEDDQQEEQFFPWWKRINPLTGRYYESDPQLNQGIPKFADGGLNMAPGEPPVGEDEFMNVLSQLSGEAGIPEEQLDAVAEAATQQTAGGLNAVPEGPLIESPVPVGPPVPAEPPVGEDEFGMAEADQIAEDEGGDVEKTYADRVIQQDGSIEIVLTGGTGHKLTEAEQKLYPEGTVIPPEIRAAWFEKDMETAMMDARSLLPSGAPPELYNILVNMAFNLGKPGLMKFDNMLGAIHGNNYPRASLEMEWIDPDDRSKGHTPWFTQTGGRSERLVRRMLNIPPVRTEVATVGEQGGIMAAANGGLTNFALGGLAGGPAGGLAEGLVAANDNVMDSGIMQTVEAVEATDEDMSGIGSLAEMNAQLVAAGEEGLIHATPGELVFDPSRLSEPDQRMVMAALETAGIDPALVTVGNEANILNQMTGLPAFGFFSKIFKGIGKGVKKVGKFLKRNAGTILGIAGAMTGNPWLAALGSGIGSLIEGKPIQAALLSAGMSFAGTKWVAPWIGKQLQAAAPSMFSPTVGATIGKVPGVPGTAFGKSVAAKTGEGIVAGSIEKSALNAAAKVAFAGGNEAAVTAAAKNAIQTGVAANIYAQQGGTALAGRAITDEVATTAAKKIAGQVMYDVASKAVSSVGQAALPAFGTGIGSMTTDLLTKPIGDIVGGQIASYGGRMGAQILEPMVTGIPAADQQAALDAWNAQYDYIPSSEQLYDFYTNTYVPNQQVDVPQTIGGIPGYGNTLLAAGGGYINGVGGPKSDSNLARLSNGEFVMTEAAVRGAGYGDRIAGARRMYDIMNGLERRAA